MKSVFIRHRHLSLAVAAALTSGLAATSADAAMRGVRLDGFVWDSAAEVPQNSPYADGMEAFRNFCRNADRDDMERIYTTMETQVAAKLGEAGMGVATDFFPDSGQIDDFLDELEDECNRDEDEDNFGLTTIIYSECRMTMDGMTGELDIKVPDGADGHMIAWDGTQGMRVNLTQRMQDVSAQVGQGWSSGLEWQSGPGDTVERAGYPATSAQFEYSMGLGAGYGSALTASQQAAEGQLDTEGYLGSVEGAGLDQSQGLQVLSGMVSSKVSGWGYFSSAAPGVDIVQSFYRNFAQNVAPSGDLGSFFGGMIASSVSLLEKGLPLELHTTVESKVMGKTMIAGKSQSVIYEVELVDLPSDWCTRSFIDESNLTDIDAQLQQAMSGSGGSSGAGAAAGAGTGPGAAPGLTAEQSQQINQGMSALNEAMGSMTKEQKEALQSMGLGSMMQQMTGANPAGQASAASAAGASAARSASSSADLTTDNMTQSVQLHLQALGYDPGTTDGTLSTETVIAISQFQAERGIEVTGEVSPQLLGILSAAVDAR